MKVCQFAVALLFSTALALPAQRTTWVVDQNGTGNFRDIPSALQAAAPGDLIVVLAGFYLDVATSKGVTLIGVGNVTVQGRTRPNAVTVTNLPAGQTFAMRNIVLYMNTVNDAAVFRFNQGRIHLQDVRTFNPQSLGTLRTAIHAEGCVSVSLQDCDLEGGPAIRADNSTLSASSSQIVGVSSRQILGGARTWAAQGLISNGGRLFLSRTSVLGGNGGTGANGLLVYPAQSAMMLNSTETTLTGNIANRVWAGSRPGQAPLAGIANSGGTLTVDPDVWVSGTQGGPDFSGPAIVREVVSLSATGGDLGGPVDAEILSPNQSVMALVLGLPGDPVSTTLGTLFFDPTQPVIGLVFGAVQSPSGKLQVRFTIPNLTQLRGIPVVLQAANFYAATSLVELSNPVVMVLD